MTDLIKELQRCAKCGKCRAVCPTFIVSRDETRVARGRISLLEAIMEGRVIPTDYGREILMSCYGCMRCSEICPSGVRIDLIVRSAREMLAKQMGLNRTARFVFRRILPNRRVYDGAIGVARFLQNLLKKNAHQPLRHLPLFFKGKRNIPPIAARPALRWLPEIVKGRGNVKVSLFLGCMLNYVYPEIAASIMHILELHGVDVILPRAQLCCGTPALAYGDVEAARALARRNLECLEPNKVDAIVLGCASCELTLKRDYPVILKGAEQLAK
ncbi:MAG: (Fe-S)-binding protein, partial [bacterium]